MLINRFNNNLYVDLTPSDFTLLFKTKWEDLHKLM